MLPRGAAALIMASALSPGLAAAQYVRGEVVSAATQIALPYSTVTLAPAFEPRMSDGSGRFAFPQVAPGQYRLTIKHIGYTPFDTTLTVVAGHELVVRAALVPLAIDLPPVTVTALGGCTNPGPPDPRAEPQLAAIFTELRENAGFFRLLSDRYPFRYWVQRRLLLAPGRLLIDTVEYRSDQRWRYAPGRMVRAAGSPQGRTERSLILPNITDLAEGAFHTAHCFTFGGVEQIDERAHLRVDFQAAAKLRSPDVDGTAWLDSASYELRRVVLRLTNPQRVQKDIADVEVTVFFDKVQPSISLPKHILSVTTYAKDQGSGWEEQRFLRMEYVRESPGGP